MQVAHFEAERRPDPTDPQSGRLYTQHQFVKFYGPQLGLQHWNKGGANRPWYEVGQKVRTTGKLSSDLGQTVEAGSVGIVTNVPGPRVRLERGAVAEVQFGEVTFDAQPNMIEPINAERRRDPTVVEGDADFGKTYTHAQFVRFYGAAQAAALWDGGAERRPDPTVVSGDKGFGRTYTRQQFDKFYGAFAAQRWAEAAPQKVVEKTVTVKREAGAALGWTRDSKTQVITEIEADGPAAKAGIAKGAKIRSVGGKKIKTDADFRAALEEAGTEIEFIITELSAPAAPAPRARPPPRHPVLIRPEGKQELALGRDLKCEEEGSTLLFDFKADGTVLAGEESLEVVDGKVAFGKIGEGGPTDGQKWVIDHGRLKSGDLALTLGEDGAVTLTPVDTSNEAQLWRFRADRDAQPERPQKTRPPPTKPVMICPRGNPALVLTRALKCEEEGSSLLFDFKADGTVLAGEESLEVVDGKVAFGKIGEEGPTDGQKWVIDHGRLMNGGKALTLKVEDSSLEMQDMQEKSKEQLWNLRTADDGETRRDPTCPTSKKRYTRAEFMQFYGRPLGAKYWRQAENL